MAESQGLWISDFRIGDKVLFGIITTDLNS